MPCHRFWCDYNNVDLTRVQPYYYRVRQVKVCHEFHDANFRTDNGQPIPALPIPPVMMGIPVFTNCLVHEELSTLDTSKSPDQLHPNLLKWSATFLTEPLVDLFNNSLATAASNARQMLLMIRWSSAEISVSVFAFLYNTLVLHHLENAMQACPPNHVADAACLEQIQQLVARLVKGYVKNTFAGRFSSSDSAITKTVLLDEKSRKSTRQSPQHQGKDKQI